MPTLALKTIYNKNTGLLISVNEFKSLYFYGIDISSVDGTKYSDDVFEMHLRQAQKEIEEYFDIKILPTLITETEAYNRDEYFTQFPIIQTDYPVNKAYSCLGLLNTTEQIIFPEVWLNSRKNNHDSYSRRISIVPTGSTTTASGDMILSGVTFQIGILSFKNIPDYFTVQYLTGFDKIQYDILNLVGMIAAIQTLAQAGDLILGAGIASQSVSIDGLSQSISSTSSATNAGYGARITEYRKTIKETIDRLKSRYTGIRFVSM